MSLDADALRRAAEAAAAAEVAESGGAAAVSTARRGSATGRRNSITGGQSSDVIQTRIRGGPIGAVGAARDPSAVLRPETEAETDEARETRASMFRV